MNTAAVYTLGCKVNTYESDAVINILKENNYKIVDFKDVADVYIINTCTVTNQADSKSRKFIRQAKKRNPDSIVIAMGCFTQVQSDLKLDEIDILIGTNNKTKIVEYINYFKQSNAKQNHVTNIQEETKFEDLNVNKYSNTRAFIKIQDGCENYCSYCIIPFARGKVRSKPVDKVISEIESIKHQYNEIVLSGIHTGQYGKDLDITLNDLLIAISKIEGLNNVRISSVEINELTDEVIDTIKNNPMFVNHFHIPLQSGCSHTLKKMNRKYNRHEFIDRVNYIREQITDVLITTDLIIGFPEETDEHFEETLDTLNTIKFYDIHVFPYSKRDNTVAARMKQVNGIIKTTRVNEVIALNERIKEEYNKSFVNKELNVLIEQKRDDYYVGHTSNFIKVIIYKSDLKINTFITIKPNNYNYESLIFKDL